MVHKVHIGRGRRSGAVQQTAGNGPKRHDERIDADIDGAAATGECDLEVFAESENDVGRHLSFAEKGDRALPGFEIAGDSGTRLARGDARQHIGVERFDVNSNGVDSQVAHFIEHSQIARGLKLHFDRQPSRLFHGMSAFRDVSRATVDAVRTPGRQGRVDGAVEFFRGQGYFGELGGCLLDDRAAEIERQPDAAKSALVGVSPVRTCLHDGARERVEVHQADFPIRNSVFGGEVVIPWTRTCCRFGQPNTVSIYAVARIFSLQAVRRARHIGGYRDGYALNPEHAGVSWTRSPAPGFHGRFDAQARTLQLDKEFRDLR